MTRRLGALAALAVVLAVAACGGDSSGGDTGYGSNGGAAPASTPTGPPGPDCHNGSKTTVEQRTSPPPQTLDPNKTYVATVHTSRGDFSLKLDPKAAPVTANNFVYLAEQHFYDCLTFHRVVPGFVVQGGDPQGNGTGGLGYKLPDETNPAPWLKGSLAMASNPAGVSGCQFFVLLGDAPHLAGNGVYNHFGSVQSGMDVVDAIRQGDQIKSIEITAS